MASGDAEREWGKVPCYYHLGLLRVCSRTLVITAAAPDRPSFGCEDGATWTYFGDAFFNRALRGSRTLDEAFCQARDIVTKRERKEGFKPSRPQMAGGSEVLPLLAGPQPKRRNCAGWKKA